MKRLHPHPMSQTGEWGIQGKQKRRRFLLFPPFLEGKVGSPQLLFPLSLGKATQRISPPSSNHGHQGTVPARGRHSRGQDPAKSAGLSPGDLGGKSSSEPSLALGGCFPTLGRPFPLPGLCQPLLCPRAELVSWARLIPARSPWGCGVFRFSCSRAPSPAWATQCWGWWVLWDVLLGRGCSVLIFCSCPESCKAFQHRTHLTYWSGSGLHPGLVVLLSGGTIYQPVSKVPSSLETDI